jgi:alpha-L-fucosidase
MLEQLAQWNAIHGEAIFGTRPWLVYGESALQVKGGHFQEDFKYSAREIRFTTKGPTLYAIALGWPEDHRLVIRSLAKPASDTINNITDISLLGYAGKLAWNQTPEGLFVTLPNKTVSPYTAALKITGTELKNVPTTSTASAIRPDAKGNFTLSADDAQIEGGGLALEKRGGLSNLGFWDDSADYATWRVHFPAPGVYRVTGSFANANEKSLLIVECAGRKLNAAIPKTKGWDDFLEVDCGTLQIDKAGDAVLTAHPGDAKSWKAINLRALKLAK